MATPVSTIKQMRDYFDLLESKWTADNTHYMGEFDSQPIVAWTDGGGYLPALATSDVDGTMIVCTERHLRVE